MTVSTYHGTSDRQATRRSPHLQTWRANRFAFVAKSKSNAMSQNVLSQNVVSATENKSAEDKYVTLSQLNMPRNTLPVRRSRSSPSPLRFPPLAGTCTRTVDFISIMISMFSTLFVPCARKCRRCVVFVALNTSFAVPGDVVSADPPRRRATFQCFPGFVSSNNSLKMHESQYFHGLFHMTQVAFLGSTSVLHAHCSFTTTNPRFCAASSRILSAPPFHSHH